MSAIAALSRRLTTSCGDLMPASTLFVVDHKIRPRSVKSIVSALLLVPLEDTVVFPNMNITLAAEIGDDERVVLVPKHENEYAKVGTVAEVVERVRLPGGAQAVAVAGLHRGLVGAAVTDPAGRLRVEVEERPDESPPAVKTRELEVEYRAIVEE